MLHVLFEDSALIVLNKPAGIPVQSDKTGDTSLIELAGAHCGQALHPVHRIDRPVSGIVLFGKTKEAMTALTEQFQARSIEKAYLAVVQQMPQEPTGTLVHHIRKYEARNISKAHEESRPGTRRAETRYRLLGSSDRYHLLEISLVSGLHHQIRAQLAAIGSPIKGDVKYGFRRGNRDRSIHLHSWRLAFEHPFSGEWIQLEASLPEQDAVWEAFREVIAAL
ncbi:MAG: RluA family pseudouridine synthase [Lewinellaceae bacterium]|nr:RluA family pseudouridine synthase [Lewinellaceae bacterium]